MYSNSDWSRDILRECVPDYSDLDPGPKQRSSLIKKYKAKIIEQLGEEPITTRAEKLVEYDHDAHMGWVRWPSFIALYNDLQRDKRFFEQPINIVLPYYIYRENLPQYLLVKFEYWCEFCGLWGSYKPKVVGRAFKLLTSLVKKLRDVEFGENWEWLCDLDTLWGYNVRTSLKDVQTEITDWVSTKETKRHTLTSLQYQKQLFAAFTQFEKVNIQRVSGKSEKSVESFLTDPNGWVVNGSSNGIKTILYDTKKQDWVKSSATKPAIFATKSLKQILKEFNQRQKQPPFKPSVKIELGWKDRLIIACGNVEYLRMAYISYNIEKNLPRDSFTTLFGGSRNKTANYLLGIAQCGQGVNLPLDAKGFDQYIGDDEIKAFFAIMEWLIKNLFSENVEMLRVLKMIVESREQFGWSVETESGILSWGVTGLPTGLRWTALIGSFVNYMRTCFFRKHLKDRLSVDVFNRVKVQGDDDDFNLCSYFMVHVLTQLYDKFSIPVNLAKTFVSPTETEYLKKIVRKNGLFGYPARKVCPTIFVSPEKKIQPDELNYLIDFGVLDGAKRRGVDMFKYCPNSDVFNMMNVPKSYGGLGVYSGKRRLVKFDVSVPKIVSGRFTLLESKRSLLVNYQNTQRNLASKFAVSFDDKRLSWNINQRFASGCIPRTNNNIVKIERDRRLITTNNTIDKLELEFIVNVLVAASTNNFKPYTVSDNYANFEWRSFLTCIDNKKDKVDVIIAMASASSLKFIDSARKFKGEDFIHVILWYYNGDFLLSNIYDPLLSDEFMSTFFGDLLFSTSCYLLLQFGSNRDSIKHSFERANNVISYILSLALNNVTTFGEMLVTIANSEDIPFSSLSKIRSVIVYLLNSFKNKGSSLSMEFIFPENWA